MLEGKVILVTGSARGLGAAIARVLARHGAKVIVNYASSADAAESLADQIGRDRAFPWRADVRDESAVTEMVCALMKWKLGKVGH